MRTPSRLSSAAAELALSAGADAALSLALGSAGVGVRQTDLRSGYGRWLNDWCHSVDLDPCEGAQHLARWGANIHPEDLPEAQRLIQGAHDLHHAEYRVRDRNGKWRWIFERGSVLERSPDGVPTRVVGVCMEIGSRKEAELEASRNQKRLEIALEVARGGMRETDLRNGTTRFSEFCFRMLGEPCNAAPLAPDFWTSRVHPEDLQRACEAPQQVVEGLKDTYEVEYRLRHADGSWRWVLDRGRATERDENGRATRMVGFVVDVTDRVRTEEALRKSEAILRSVTENTPDWLLLVDAQLEVCFMNRGCGHYSAEQVMGRNLLEFIPKSEHARLRSILAGVFSTGTQARFEVRFPLAEDGWRDCEYRAVPVVDDGRIRFLSLAVTDITESKRAAHALRESQSILETVAANSADWLALFDLQRRCIFLNRALHGHPPEAWIGQQAESFVPPEDRERVHDIFEHVMRTGEPRDFAQVINDPERGLRHLEVRVRAVQDEGSIFGTAVNITEVTEQHAQREALRTQARILETMREGVVLVDAASDAIRLTNAAFDRMFGYEPGELLGTPVAPLLKMSAVQRRRFELMLRESATVVEPTPLDLECERRDGACFMVSCLVSPLTLAGADHWIAVLSDITERKHLEREIIEIANREQQRIGSDLHDGLGQDLTGIALILRSVAAQLQKEGSAARFDVEDVIGLVNNAIESSRALARGLSPVSADRGGLVGALQDLVARARARYSFHVEFINGCGDTRLDDTSATHLYRIAQEAFTNVIRHGQASRVTITLETTDDELHLRIEDNGRGFGSSPPDGASGLGLKIMRYRTQILGGDLVLEDVPGGGACVRCSCPLERLVAREERAQRAFRSKRR